MGFLYSVVRGFTMTKISDVHNQLSLRPILVVMILTALATPVVTLGQGIESRLKDHTESLMFGYIECVTSWTGEYVGARASPTEIAEAAHSKCLSEFQKLEEAQKNYLLSITPAGIPETRAIDKAKSISTDIREMTKAHIIRLIIETQSEK